MGMSMSAVCGWYPFIVWAATPVPRRRIDDLSRSIDVLWHLQTSTAVRQESAQGKRGPFLGVRGGTF